MRIQHSGWFFSLFLLLCAAACVLVPVTADNGTISIAYRGSGGGYIGDTIVFDGRNTYGNYVSVKITGPGLPASGVPVTNLNGAVGTGTPIEVDKYGAWKYAWYGSSIPGIEKLQTARYTFTATDSEDPGRSASTSIMLKKPEFYITVSPNPANPGDYISITGTAEQDISSINFEISDESGKVLHSFTSPVGSSGYLSYGFHGDMGPGRYTVTVSNPVLKAPYSTVLQVVAPEGTQPAATVPAQETVTVPAPETTTESVPAAAETTRARSPVAPATIIGAIAIGLLVLANSRR